jgi:hypothetical protein
LREPELELESLHVEEKMSLRLSLARFAARDVARARTYDTKSPG